MAEFHEHTFTLLPMQTAKSPQLSRKLSQNFRRYYVSVCRSAEHGRSMSRSTPKKVGQSRSKPVKAGQILSAKPVKAGQSRSKLVKAGQSRSKPVSPSELVNAGKDR
jgi:hypothetical protein